tara:strand:+ start:602 stop:754 length:153 start_codon:yes stop_codon:yes gene_type:complete
MQALNPYSKRREHSLKALYIKPKHSRLLLRRLNPWTQGVKDLADSINYLL